jgi:hypothetical protein
LWPFLFPSSHRVCGAGARRNETKETRERRRAYGKAFINSYALLPFVSFGIFVTALKRVTVVTSFSLDARYARVIFGEKEKEKETK